MEDCRHEMRAISEWTTSPATSRCLFRPRKSAAVGNKPETRPSSGVTLGSKRVADLRRPRVHKRLGIVTHIWVEVIRRAPIVAGVAVAGCNAVPQKLNFVGGQRRQPACNDVPAACCYWINAKATERQEAFPAALAVPVGLACFDNSDITVVANNMSTTHCNSQATVACLVLILPTADNDRTYC